MQQHGVLVVSAQLGCFVGHGRLAQVAFGNGLGAVAPVFRGGLAGDCRDGVLPYQDHFNLINAFSESGWSKQRQQQGQATDGTHGSSFTQIVGSGARTALRGC
ncbi:hypothetical protein D3C75_1157200 [compost metagenome]